MTNTRDAANDAAGDAAPLAPIIPIFGASPSERHPARSAIDRGKSAAEDAGDEGSALAEQTLLRKLRSTPLSLAEARAVLRDAGADALAADDILDDCVRRGYLDDAALAELLVRAGVERKGLGRAALARALAQRGIEREVIDGALEALPNDDAERALEYARRKARSMVSLEREVAVRRLAGQLVRRGFTASARSAASQAVDETRAGASGVHFR